MGRIKLIHHHPLGMQDGRGNAVAVPQGEGLRWTLRPDLAGAEP